MLGGLQPGPPGIPVANPVFPGVVETPGQATKSGGQVIMGGRLQAYNLLCTFFEALIWPYPH